VKPKNQRLILVALALAAAVAAVLLALSALRDQAAYFYAPADLVRDRVEPGRAIRLGGMVAPGSLRREADGVTLRFLVTDGQRAVPVRFRGIPPDLFREGSGVVAEGALAPDGGFVASNILAKHDERYMPPEVAGAMHKSESLEGAGTAGAR
jgi:cytochrome c-type biogenesis protein CcmE